MDPEYFTSYNMCWGTLGTIRPFPGFHADRDAMEIREALENKNAVTLLRILTNRTNAQRQEIAKTFEEQTQKVEENPTFRKNSREEFQALEEKHHPFIRHQLQNAVIPPSAAET